MRALKQRLLTQPRHTGVFINIGAPPGPADTATWSEQRDVATLLYSNVGGSLIMTGVIAVFLVLVLGSAIDAVVSGLWLCGMFVVLAIRTLDLLHWHPRRMAGSATGRLDLVCFAAGTLSVCAVWAMFPLLFFPGLDPSRSTGAFVVMAAMAGGSTSVLGPSLFLSTAYCAAQLLVPALVYFSLPGQENRILGLLAVAMFLFLALTSRQANRSITGALRLNRLNQALDAKLEQQRRELQTANQQLVTAQAALSQANQAVGRPTERRTEDAEREAARQHTSSATTDRLASTDPLTGLGNRASFASRLSTMLLDAADTGTHLAVLFLDIDNFRQINDVRGHRAGDALLQVAASRMGEVVGESGGLARWEGDEFVVAVPATSRDRAARLADALRQAMLRPLDGAHERVCLDVTIGVALYPDDGRTEDELIRAADMAMYEAKKQGKGRVRQFDPGLARDLAAHYRLEQALRGAAERGEFSLAFQPIFDSASGRCQAVETLLRWTHPELGVVEPIRAIQAAEQSGQIASIGRWVLQQACRTAATWPGAAPAVTVNVSVAQVQSGTLLEDVAAALAQSGLPPARLQLEITESMFVTDPVRIAPVFEELRRRGHKILLDDFGTGYSSLAYLSKLPLDVIKVDRSFVAAAEHEGYAIIHAILSIARALSLAVTAEGVETEAQQAVLVAMGVDNLQGYLLSRPMTATALAAWLQTEPRAIPCEQW